jgi:hypothetical protein
LHIISFVLGALGVSALVVAVANGAGFAGWPAFGMGAACFVLAQVLYLVWLAGMARAEAQRRKTSVGGAEPVSTKPNGGVVQKG